MAVACVDQIDVSVQTVAVGGDGVAILMDQGHDRIGLAVGLIAIGQLVCHLVHSLNRVGHRDALHHAGGDYVLQIGGDGTDEGDLFAVDGLDGIRLETVGSQRAAGDVGGDPVDAVLRFGDAVVEVCSALVELMIAQGAHTQIPCLCHVQRRSVLEIGGFEWGSTHEVSAGDEHAVARVVLHGKLLISGFDPLAGFDVSVEVGDVEHGHLLGVLTGLAGVAGATVVGIRVVALVGVFLADHGRGGCAGLDLDDIAVLVQRHGGAQSCG